MRKSQLSGVGAFLPDAKSQECPFCTELLGPDLLHICPAGCCFVEGFQGAKTVICPYCAERIHTSAGHVCLELIARTEPVQ